MYALLRTNKRDKNPMQTAGKRLPNAGKRGQTTGDKRAIYKVLCRRLSASPKRNKCAIAARKQEEVPERNETDSGSYDTPYHKGGRAGVARGESKKK